MWEALELGAQAEEAGSVCGDLRGKSVWYSLDHRRLAGLRRAIDA